MSVVAVACDVTADNGVPSVVVVVVLDMLQLS